MRCSVAQTGCSCWPWEVDVVSMSEDRVISGMTGWEDPAQPGLQCNPTDNKPSGTSITLLWRSTATPAGYLWRELCRNFPHSGLIQVSSSYTIEAHSSTDVAPRIWTGRLPRQSPPELPSSPHSRHQPTSIEMIDVPPNLPCSGLFNMRILGRPRSRTCLVCCARDMSQKAPGTRYCT